MLTNLTVVIILQYIYILNHHVVYFKRTQHGCRLDLKAGKFL